MAGPGRCQTVCMPTGDAAEFRILGPLEVAVGSGRLDLGGARQQVVLAMLLLGLLATWIPAQRALSVNPLVLLREE